jgi:hypothetical protein
MPHWFTIILITYEIMLIMLVEIIARSKYMRD